MEVECCLNAAVERLRVSVDSGLGGLYLRHSLDGRDCRRQIVGSQLLRVCLVANRLIGPHRGGCYRCLAHRLAGSVTCTALAGLGLESCLNADWDGTAQRVRMMGSLARVVVVNRFVRTAEVERVLSVEGQTLAKELALVLVLRNL